LATADLKKNKNKQNKQNVQYDFSHVISFGSFTMKINIGKYGFVMA